MNKNILTLIGIIIILGLGIYFATQSKTKNSPESQNISTFEECVAAGNSIQESYPERCNANGKTFTQDIGNELEKSNMIMVETPRPGQLVSSPLTIKGKARGNWYFEASFPTRLIDANGKVLGFMPIQAKGDWMTTEFVPFVGTLNFDTPLTKTGTLILQKDNPSGLPENADELRIPIIFNDFDSSVGAKTSVKVFFGNSEQYAECAETKSVTREVPNTVAIGESSIEELLKGPTTIEKSEGFSTALNSDVKLNSLIISNGTARVDFDSGLNDNVAGSCRVLAIRAQIENTLKQFSTVQNVVISVDGKKENILEP